MRSSIDDASATAESLPADRRPSHVRSATFRDCARAGTLSRLRGSGVSEPCTPFRSAKPSPLPRPVGLDRGTVAPDSPASGTANGRGPGRRIPRTPGSRTRPASTSIGSARAIRRRGARAQDRRVRRGVRAPPADGRTRYDVVRDRRLAARSPRRRRARGGTASWRARPTCGACRFPPASFDVVLSTSTLDHFDRRDEIAVALAELRRVLADGGRLLVTLDNPANPILRLRQLDLRRHRRDRRPHPVPHGAHALAARARRGRRAGRARGVRERLPDPRAARAGALGRRVGGATRARPAPRAGLGRALRAIERVGASPADAALERRTSSSPSAGPRVAVGARPRSTRGRRTACRAGSCAGSWPSIGCATPISARCRRRCSRASIRRSGASSALVRRVAAAPIYLRHPLDAVQGGATARHGSRCGARAHAPQALARRAVRRPADGGRGDRCSILPTVSRRAPTRSRPECDLLIAHTTPALRRRSRRAGFHVVPGMVRFGGEPAALLAAHRATLESARRRPAPPQHARLSRRALVVHARAEPALLRPLSPAARARPLSASGPRSRRFAMIDRLFAAGLARRRRRARRRRARRASASWSRVATRSGACTSAPATPIARSCARAASPRSTARRSASRTSGARG